MQITISIENEKELISLWRRLNMAESELIDTLACDYAYDYHSEHGGCYNAWKTINDLVKSSGLEDQL